MSTRSKCDALGCVELPADALHGIQTARALENLAFSRHALRTYPAYVRALAAMKCAAAQANRDTGALAPASAEAVRRLPRRDGRRLYRAFSRRCVGWRRFDGVNMNVNEVKD